jgi:hypothetical protein
MPTDVLPDAAGGVLEDVRRLDDLVAANLRDAVAQAEAVARCALIRTMQLQRIADELPRDATAAPLRMAIEDQVSELLRAGQYHDILGQVVDRSISIHRRRAELVESLVAALHQGDGGEPLRRSAAELLEHCRNEQARHSGALKLEAAAVELF